MKITITEPAEADLEAIGDWIAQENPERALTFVLELRQSCETLSDLPYGYTMVQRYEHTGIRRRVHGNYLIFYRIVADAIEVLHILHGARNYDAILFPDG